MAFHQIVHSTPRGRKRKELFQSFFPTGEKICQRSRENANDLPNGRPKNREDPSHKPGGPRQKTPGEGTEEGEVKGRAQQQPEGDIQPHPAPLEGHAAEKQRAAGPQPEKQVQGLLEEAPGEGEPELAKQIIEQPHRHPRDQGEDQGGDLGLQGDAHPRNSRPRKLPWLGSSSS